MSQVSNLNRSRCPSVHCRSDESIIASWPAMNNWFDQLLVWDVALAPNEYMKFGTKDMLVESVFGWGKHCCRLVCCHGNDVAHSLNVSTSLSFFPIEYGEAFKELCNSGTNGTEQVGDARSNKDQRDVQDVEECMYAMICSTWVMFGPSNEHNQKKLKRHQQKLRILRIASRTEAKLSSLILLRNGYEKHPQSISGNL